MTLPTFNFPGHFYKCKACGLQTKIHKGEWLPVACYVCHWGRNYKADLWGTTYGVWRCDPETFEKTFVPMQFTDQHRHNWILASNDQSQVICVICGDHTEIGWVEPHLADMLWYYGA